MRRLKMLVPVVLVAPVTFFGALFISPGTALATNPGPSQIPILSFGLTNPGPIICPGGTDVVANPGPINSPSFVLVKPGPSQCPPAVDQAASAAGLGTLKAPSTLVASGNPYDPTGPPIGRIRVVNLYLLPNGKPGPALDFYDTSHPASSDKPLIRHLAYAQVSAYVSPRAGEPLNMVTTDYANLYMFPAGSKKFGAPIDFMQAGTNISNTGWVKGEQQTIVMGSGDQFGSVKPPSFATVDEVEPPKSQNGQTELIKPPAGMGLLVSNVEGLVEDTSKYGGVDLRIDGRCPDNILVATNKPANDSNDPTSPATISNYNAANFPLSVGSHALNVVDEPGPGSGLDQKQCQAAPAVTTTVVKISKSAPTLVLIYGRSPKQARMLVAKIG